MIVTRALIAAPQTEEGSPCVKTSPLLHRGAVRAALAAILLHLFFAAVVSAKEDNVRLNFQKTAANRTTQVYIVKKGDILSRIFRSQRGDEPVPYALIRQLNPRIKDLNRIYPGQKILLPIRDSIPPPEPKETTATESKTPERKYAIREGDSISRIILRELDASPKEVIPIYRLLRQLNPDITDLAHLRAGDMLTLPSAGRGSPSPEASTTSLLTEEKTIAESALTPHPLAEALLGYIRPVIRRMSGTVTTGGNYFIPLKDTAQVTIDCSLIPVVELDDGSTVLLDYGNRLSDGLRDLIRQSWPNYAFLSPETLRDSLTALQGIIRHSRDYTMSSADKPLAAVEDPEILVFPDWIIAAKKAAGANRYRQALFLLDAYEKPFPDNMRNALEKSGLVVTEITAGNVALSSEPTTVSTVSDMRELKGIALAEQLLKALGEAPIRGADIVLFNQERDGFSLSILPELLIEKKEKRFIITTKRLPEQFVRILQQEATGVILIAEDGSGRSFAEGLLRGLNMPVSFGHFSFRIPHDGKRARLAVAFPALRVTTTAGTPFYLIAFDVPPDVMPLLQGPQGVPIGKY